MENVMKDEEVIVAIDPGANGGIVVGNINGEVYQVDKMPATPKDLLEYLKDVVDGFMKVTCVLEKVGGIPGQGGMAMFNFGKGFGYLEMALLACGIATEEVTPQKWQKVFQMGSSKGYSKTEWKNKLKAKAQMLYPLQKVTLWNSDALLLYKYGLSIINTRQHL